jgi:hypothetical protein
VNVLFLDIDGVLALNLGKKLHDKAPPFHPRCVELLNAVFEYADVKVVVISTWRLDFSFEGLKRALAFRGFAGEVIGTTRIPKYDPDAPLVLAKGRDEEVRIWLAEHGKDVRRFAVLDDTRANIASFGELGVHVNSWEGVTRATQRRLVDIFTRPV